MFQKLVSHNDDLRRLVERGFAVAFDSECLVVRDIPYLDASRVLCKGAFVTKLVFTDPDHVQQQDHQVFFAGLHPHALDGSPIRNLGGGEAPYGLSPDCADVVVQRSFSNKPKSGSFANFFDKIESYTAIVAGPAMELHQASPYTGRCVDTTTDTSVFRFPDTLTSRAEIRDLADKLKEDVVALIGLGGTGGYLLDFLVKSPVREIRAFDLDPFHVHNAFRAPGRVQVGEFGLSKAAMYQERYANFRTGLSCQARFIDTSAANLLAGVTFAFVCVDTGPSRAGIFDVLQALRIPFLDVGMGLHRKEGGGLRGMVRTTYFSAEQAQAVRDQQLADLSGGGDNLYRTNIQISELNALNATFAMIRFKQLRGYYHAGADPYHLLFNVEDFSLQSLP